MPTPTVLIVDDTPANVDLVESILSAEGFRTLVACDGPSSLAVCGLDLPDLILMDVMMPGETGFETCARLKADPATADIPIIFLSALDDVDSKVTGLKIGGVDYVSKPVHGEELLARVRVHLRISENNRLLAAQHHTHLEQLRNAQQAILVRPEDCPEAAFSVYFDPLEEAGGDVYDVVSSDPGVFNYFVADVSGHGVTAAFLTSAIKALLRQYTGPMYSPEDTMRGLDSVMRHVLVDAQYLTACYARLNLRSGCLSIVSAGHPPAILVNTEGKTETIDMASEPLGVFNSIALQRRDVWVNAGDRFFLYTDGMIESSPGSPRRAGLDRLIAACTATREVPLEEVPERIAKDLELAGGSGKKDDLLLMTVEVRP